VAKGIRTTVVLALGVVVALGVQHASAHNKVHPSEVTLQVGKAIGGTDWYGHVISPRARCTRSRKVEVYRRLDGADQLIGKDVTGTGPDVADNEYVIFQEGSPESGTYVAVAKRKVLRRTSRHRHICARAVSTPVVLDEI
jgi:hypothetical protein